jgi:RNA polymerase sigma-70 factor, ECF subfamily
MDLTGNDADEAQLIENAASGDAGAFAELFNRHYSMIHAFAYRLSLSSTDAQDVAQETFIKAAQSIGSFRRETSFKNWLYRIAVNASRDLHRRRVRESRVTDELTAGQQSEAREADFGEVHEALGTLATELRQAIVLVYYEGLNHAQAARVCGCAEATISWRLFIAKRTLKSVLQPRNR